MENTKLRRIPVAGPSITQREVDYVADAARGDWYENAGRYIGRFERAFAAYVGTEHAVSVPHCTAALHLSLLALGVSPGHEVIVPDSTWIASVAPVSYVGAKPVFVDVDRERWCLDPDAVARAITSQTKAIIVVDLYGSLPDYARLQAIANDANIPIIEDAAEAFGSSYHGKQAGSLGDVGAFSFHGSKTLTTGEGGMLVTSRRDIYDRVLVLRDHGRSPGDRFFQNQEIGYKYKMSSVQAALGLGQLERASELIAKKRLIFQWYKSRLVGLPGLALNAEPDGVSNSYWMVTCVLDESVPLTTHELMSKLSDRGIDSRPFFSPLTSLAPYASSTGRNTNPNAYALARCAVNLPSALSLSEDDVDRVCAALRGLIST